MVPRILVDREGLGNECLLNVCGYRRCDCNGQKARCQSGGNASHHVLVPEREPGWLDIIASKWNPALKLFGCLTKNSVYFTHTHQSTDWSQPRWCALLFSLSWIIAMLEGLTEIQDQGPWIMEGLTERVGSESNEKWKWQKFISQDDTIIVNCRQPLKSSRVTSSLPGRPTAQIKLWLLTDGAPALVREMSHRLLQVSKSSAGT